MIIKTIHRTAWLIGGVVSLLLTVIGLLLPIIPQLPFLLISVFCFMRCSPRFNIWLSHQHWFAHIHDWAEQKHWFKHIKEHLPKPGGKNHTPS